MEARLRCIPGAEAPSAGSSEDTLLDGAARLGFELVSYQSDTDQTVWEWRQGDGPRPQFVTERVARQWMVEWLAHQPDVVEPQPLDERRRDHGDGAAGVPPVAESA